MLAGLLLLAGCQGHSAFRRGEELYGLGDYREAYLSFWEAHRLKPCAKYQEALRRAGRRVAEFEWVRGMEAERREDYSEALGTYALALEYDSGWTPLCQAYQRAHGLVSGAEARELEIAAARSARKGWKELDLLMAAARGGPARAGLQGDLERALRTSVEVLAQPSRRETFESPLPARTEELERIAGGWRRLHAECRQRLLAEEDGWFSPHLREREIASWGLCRQILAPFMEEAKEAERWVDRAAAGSREAEKAESLEARGELSHSLDGYLKATLLHPAHEAARAGRIRVLGRMKSEAYQSALVSARKRQWREAIEPLKVLLRHDPEHREGRELFDLARRELASKYLLEARRFESSGLLGNALLDYFQALDLRPEDPALRSAASRIEEALGARLRPRLRVSLRSTEPDERRARRDLWNVSEAALSRLERDLMEALQEKLNGFFPEPPGDARAARAAPCEAKLIIEDLDFFCRAREASPGVATARYVESLQLLSNQLLPEAEQGLRESRDLHEKAIEFLRAAPPQEQSFAAALESFSRLRLAQAKTYRDLLPPRIARASWESVTYPTVERRVEVELAARYRLEMESRWASAVLELCDRLVPGDGARNIPSDPEELPSRSEALRLLTPRLAEELAADVGNAFAAKHRRLHEEALSHVSAGAFDLAVENLVLFLYASRGRCDPLAADAARRLKELTGCDLPSSWEKPPSPSGSLTLGLKG